MLPKADYAPKELLGPKYSIRDLRRLRCFPFVMNALVMGLTASSLWPRLTSSHVSLLWFLRQKASVGRMITFVLAVRIVFGRQIDNGEHHHR